MVQHHIALVLQTAITAESRVVEIIGALVAGFLLTSLFGISTINPNNLSLPALLVSLLGAVILLAIVNFFRRGAVR